MQNEAREREEQEALEAEHQREIEREALELKTELAAQRFELVWAEFCSKAGYNPNQPRVPAGNPDGGQWTGGEGGVDRVSSSELSSAQRRPPILGDNPPPDLPKERPTSSQERTAAIKAAARFVGAIWPPAARAAALGTLLESGASWLREYKAEIETSLDPPKSLQELHDAVATDRPGTHKHHIVEQTPAEQDGYPREQINAPDNLVRIPKRQHRDISDWYQTKNPNFDDLPPRDWLRGRSWEERRRVGLDALVNHGVLKP